MDNSNFCHRLRARVLGLLLALFVLGTGLNFHLTTVHACHDNAGHCPICNLIKFAPSPSNLLAPPDAVHLLPEPRWFPVVEAMASLAHLSGPITLVTLAVKKSE